MEAKFIFAQFLAFCGAVLYFISYQCRDNRKLYMVQLFSYLFYTVHFFVLGAETGGISYILNLAGSIFLAGKWNFARSNKMCMILCSLQLVVAAATWAGWISLLPVSANIASTIIGSWLGALDAIASDLSALISIPRYGWKNLGNVKD